MSNPGATSVHFGQEELACPHCGVNGATQGLVDALEEFRAKVNEFLASPGTTPVRVSSAYRCAIHNAQVGGAAGSEHKAGEAADVSVKGLDGAELEIIARSCPLIHGIGRDDFRNYVHIDVRPRKAEWAYNAAGKWIPYYAPNVEEKTA